MDELGLTSGTVSVRMDRLVAQGLVDRRPDPQSARNTLIRLTEHGRELFERVVPAHLANEQRLLSALSPQELELLADLLRKLLVEFEGHAHRPASPCAWDSRWLQATSPPHCARPSACRRRRVSSSGRRRRRPRRRGRPAVGRRPERRRRRRAARGRGVARRGRDGSAARAASRPRSRGARRDRHARRRCAGRAGACRTRRTSALTTRTTRRTCAARDGSEVGRCFLPHRGAAFEPGPHRPERCALPGCATPRGPGECSHVSRRVLRRVRR